MIDPKEFAKFLQNNLELKMKIKDNQYLEVKIVMKTPGEAYYSEEKEVVICEDSVDLNDHTVDLQRCM